MSVRVPASKPSERPLPDLSAPHRPASSLVNQEQRAACDMFSSPPSQDSRQINFPAEQVPVTAPLAPSTLESQLLPDVALAQHSSPLQLSEAYSMPTRPNNLETDHTRYLDSSPTLAVDSSLPGRKPEHGEMQQSSAKLDWVSSSSLRESGSLSVRSQPSFECSDPHQQVETGVTRSPEISPHHRNHHIPLESGDKGDGRDQGRASTGMPKHNEQTRNFEDNIVEPKPGEDNCDSVQNRKKLSVKIMPHHGPQKLGAAVADERNRTPEELYRLKVRRAELAKEVQEQQSQQEREDPVDEGMLITRGPYLEVLENNCMAASLADGIATIDAEQLDSHPDGDTDEATSRSFSRPSRSTPITMITPVRESSGESESDALPSSPTLGPSTHFFHRRASSPSGTPMFAILSKHTSVATSVSKHIQFAARPGLQDTPFTQTLKYFKQFKSKENSASKARRNASLPEEIAELARDVQHMEDLQQDIWDAEGSGDSSLEDLEQYREMDLAPMDPVMEDELAGDLIMLGTPTQARGSPRLYRESTEERPEAEDASESNGIVDEGEGTRYKLVIPGHYGEENTIFVKSQASSEHIAAFIRDQGRALDAAEDDIEGAVRKFRANPQGFVVAEDESSAIAARNMEASADEMANASDKVGNGENNANPYAVDYGGQMQISKFSTDSSSPASNEDAATPQEQPVVINVIGMLPAALFYAVAQPVAHLSNKAYDKVLEKIYDLTMQPEESENA